MSIRWGSIIADERGEIQQEKLRSLVAIALALAGGFALYLAMMARVTPSTEIVGIGVTALILPLTGGKIADVITTWRMTKVATKAATVAATVAATTEMQTPPGGQ